MGGFLTGGEPVPFFSLKSKDTQVSDLNFYFFAKHFFEKKKCYIYNIFTTNHRWLVIIDSNLKLTLRLLFCPDNNNQ